jgi:hypothetical protein
VLPSIDFVYCLPTLFIENGLDFSSLAVIRVLSRQPILIFSYILISLAYSSTGTQNLCIACKKLSRSIFDTVCMKLFIPPGLSSILTTNKRLDPVAEGTLQSMQYYM